MKKSNIITLTTDFGLMDPYVAMMKGVILSINPEVKIVDISHSVKAGAIAHASGLIQESFDFFPKGTIHVGVVDPGVGGNRRPILVKTEDHFFIGPDNGLFWPIINSNNNVEIIHLTESGYFLPCVSSTFHGRDIFAPIAAHLSCNADPLKMGNTIIDPIQLHLPVPQHDRITLSGQVMHMDNFGNLITNIRKQDLDQFAKKYKKLIIEAGDLVIKGVHETYVEAKVGKALALISSSGYLEIAVNQGRAGDQLGMNSEKPDNIKIIVRR